MPKLIIYGNCQAGALHSILSTMPAVTDRWQVVYHDLWPDEERMSRELRDFDEADTLLLQNIGDWNAHPLHDKLPDHLRVVRYPFCYFAALWPFDACVAGPDYPMIEALRAASAQGEPVPFAFQDALLRRLRSEIADPIERFARYRSLDLKGVPNIERYAELEEDRLVADDRKLDFTMGQFIVDNYRGTRLFHAITHPTAILVDRLVGEVLRKMDIDPSDAPPFDESHMAQGQVPLHPQVIERLGLRWVTPNTLYTHKFFTEISFDEYYYEYISYL